MTFRAGLRDDGFEKLCELLDEISEAQKATVPLVVHALPFEPEQPSVARVNCQMVVPFPHVRAREKISKLSVFRDLFERGQLDLFLPDMLVDFFARRPPRASSFSPLSQPLAVG